MGPKSESREKNARSLAKELRNIGPKMAEKMIAANICSADQLRELGAKEAFLLMYPKGDNYGDYNAAYLYALEAAIRDCDWSDVPVKVRKEMQRFAQQLQEKNS